MTPLDIVKVLSAAAPIVASVASATKPETQIIERKEEPKIINNISNTISITNNFYVNSKEDALKLSSSIQGQMLESFSSGDRFKL